MPSWWRTNSMAPPTSPSVRIPTMFFAWIQLPNHGTPANENTGATKGRMLRFTVWLPAAYCRLHNWINDLGTHGFFPFFMLICNYIIISCCLLPFVSTYCTCFLTFRFKHVKHIKSMAHMWTNIKKNNRITDHITQNIPKHLSNTHMDEHTLWGTHSSGNISTTGSPMSMAKAEPTAMGDTWYICHQTRNFNVIVFLRLLVAKDFENKKHCFHIFCHGCPRNG